MLNNQHSAQNQLESLASEEKSNGKVLKFITDKRKNAITSKDKTSKQTALSAYELLERTVKKIDGAYAKSTIRAYYADVLDLIRFCELKGTIGLPVSSEDLSSYIAHLTSSGKTSASIRRVIAGVATIHKLNRLEDPTKDPDVLLEMRRMHRKLGRYSKQALGITSDMLEKLLIATEAGNRGSRDRALLLLAYDTLCRRSELVELYIEDIKIIEQGGLEKMSILIRKSKTDQYAIGKRFTLSDRAKLAVQEWLERLRKPKSGLLFRGVDRTQKIIEPLSPGQINRIYKRLAIRAGYSKAIIEKISGHSLRVGHAQDMVNAGESLPMIMCKGRWSKTDTVMRYVEHIQF
jgi:site-specific recombinase XerD